MSSTGWKLEKDSAPDSGRFCREPLVKSWDEEGQNVKKFWKEILCAGVLGLLLPAVALRWAWSKRIPEDIPAQTLETAPTQAKSRSLSIPVLLEDGPAVSMDMEEYLAGVILAEMPADFELEAKKAQAVVARTYALLRNVTAVKHDGGAVCTDPSCCQGYISPEEYVQKGGGWDAVEQARQAARQTQDQVLTYDGALIEATYFSCSGGRTEDAVAVWGADIPYLRSTDSPGEENAAHYTDTVRFSASEFTSALGAELSGTPETWFGEITYTQGGGVDTMVIGGVTYKGTTLRACLGLRSTAFAMTALGDTITVTTKGYGHRVGMSQYGAEAMAAQGSSYDQILAHYYQGTTLEVYPIDKAGDLQ